MTEQQRKIILKALACQIILTEEAIHKGESLVDGIDHHELSEHLWEETAFHAQLVTLRRQELKEYKSLFTSIECPETMAYRMGFHYGNHSNFTAYGASSPTGQPYLWELYTDWLLDVKCADATMEDFRNGFIDGVSELAKGKAL